MMDRAAKRLLLMAALAATTGCNRSTTEPSPVPTSAAASAVVADPAVTSGAAAVKQLGAGAFMKANGTGSAAATALFKAMEGGNAEALALAGELRPAADAGWAEALDVNAALALPTNPDAVLGLVDHGSTVEGLCTSPFIEPEAGVERKYLDRALAALKAGGAEGANAQRRQKCLTLLTKLSAEVQ
jgi:hypothetical protein